MKKKRIIVSVDGPAGSGKSSVSKEAARSLGLKYIDSGALYRAVTLLLLEKYGTIPPSIRFDEDLGRISITQEFCGDGTSRTFVDARDVSLAIRSEEIAKNIGPVSDNIIVRNFVNELLRNWSREDSIIMDGRDIGTVVFPDADLKVYLDASVEVRAERRIDEYRSMGKYLDEKSVRNQIILRDNQDRSRPFGRLIQAEDAVTIDTSGMRRNEVIEKLKSLIRQIQM